ncbi:MAG: penicillin-binding protein activator [Deltaproteobacteria bacterium]|nr:penicillin-binding protein activator [Deltaproteobacteria bacterium]
MKIKFIAIAFAISLALVPIYDNIAYGAESPRKLLSKIFLDIETNGANEGNLRQLKRFIGKHRRSDMVEEAVMKIASIYTEQKDFESAISAYRLLVDKFSESRDRSDSLYKLGYSLYRKGNILEAKSVLQSLATTENATVEAQIKAELLLTTIAAVTSSLNDRFQEITIGAVLPLSGNYAPYGERALKGILLAAGVYGEADGDSPVAVEVKVHDTALSEKSTAKNPMERDLWNFLKKEDVEGIIGPLRSKNALGAAKVAKRRRVPAIILSQKEEIAKSGKNIFRNFITPKMQAETLAEYATRALCKERFAILYPENPYGKKLASLFSDAVKKRGASVVAISAYEPKKKDFGEEFTELFGIEMEETMQGRRRVTEYTTTKKIDALFIPDNYATISQIAPYIAYYNIEDLQLLGSNGWNSTELIRSAGDYIQGAVFVDGFFPRSKRRVTHDFVTLFKEAYGYEPAIIEAEAFDATRVLLSGIDTSVEKSISIKDAIATMKPTDGVTGLISFDSDGETEKSLFLLKFERRRIVEIADPYNESIEKESILKLRPLEYEEDDLEELEYEEEDFTDMPMIGPVRPAFSL